MMALPGGRKSLAMCIPPTRAKKAANNLCLKVDDFQEMTLSISTTQHHQGMPRTLGWACETLEFLSHGTQIYLTETEL